MILWRDVRRFLEHRYAIAKVNYGISRCTDCESKHRVRLCETHRAAMNHLQTGYDYT